MTLKEAPHCFFFVKKKNNLEDFSAVRPVPRFPSLRGQLEIEISCGMPQSLQTLTTNAYFVKNRLWAHLNMSVGHIQPEGFCLAPPARDSNNPIK